MGACLSQESNGEVRIKHSLNRKEEQFVNKRRKRVLKNLQKLKIPCSLDKVPNIALLGSGGGQRAMVALLGSLVQLGKAGLLDYVLYLSGVSGSTWCMASLYQEPDWSSKLETLQEKIVQRLSGPAVSFTDLLLVLRKYYKKDFFSLTDFWAVVVVTSYVKEINEHTLTEMRNQHKNDPYPIYTMIDKKCKQLKDGDPWFEVTPHEAGYSLTGAFVKTFSFGCQFDGGHVIKHQSEMDMLYLQALCGSAVADEQAVIIFIWQTILDKIIDLIDQIATSERLEKDPNPSADRCCQVLKDLAELNLSALKGTDHSAFHQSITTTMNELSDQHVAQLEKFSLAEIQQYTLDIIACLKEKFDYFPFNAFFDICSCAVQWIWGRNYDFLHNMNNKAVPPALLESETRDYIDAGPLNNSPYISVLREERDIDLIISLDFSEGDPFETVTETAKTCKKLNISFPEVNIPDEDVKKPKDFYVFKGQNAPTVIHIPLFNQINCGDKLEHFRLKYGTFQGPYSAEMIRDLVDVAGKNISNNREKLLKQISAAVGQKRFRRKHQ